MKHYFDILEIQPGATPDEVKQAYRDLAKVWHPDRFKGEDERLKSKAAEKLAEINEAYQKIRTYQQKNKQRLNNTSSGNSTYRTTSKRQHTAYSRPVRPNTSTGNSYTGYSRPKNEPTGRNYSRSSRSNNEYARRTYSSYNQQKPPPKSPDGAEGNRVPPETAHSLARRRANAMMYQRMDQRQTRMRRKRKKRMSMVLYVGMGGALVVLITMILYMMDRQHDQMPDSLLATLARAEMEAKIAAEENQPEGAEFVGDTLASVDSQADLVQRGGRGGSRPRPSGFAAPDGFFTLGSSKADVIRVMGSPDYSQERMFRYGNASIFFNNNVVMGWQKSAEDQLLVLLSPRRDTDNEYFTIGSSIDEVLAVQGTPDQYVNNGREFYYGESRVTFEAGLVSSWSQHEVYPLKARLLPKSFSNAANFTLGSSRDEVLSVQGTPDQFGPNTFHYGHSRVTFEENQVVGWYRTHSDPLRVELLPNEPTEAEYFMIGSTRDEVLAAQGTPDQYSERIFKYGYSTVSFEGEIVVSTYSSVATPLNCRGDC